MRKLLGQIPSIRQVLPADKLESLVKACDEAVWNKELLGLAQHTAWKILTQTLKTTYVPNHLRNSLTSDIMKKWFDELRLECAKRKYECRSYYANEDEVKREYLAPKLTLEGFKVYVEVDLGPKLAMRGVNGPGQPPIDILLYNPKDRRFHGIEVKYFRREGGPESYYAGVDEALALLAYGVDYAYLYHIFDPNLKDENCMRQANFTLKILKATPCGYRAIKICSTTDYIHKPATLNPFLTDPTISKIKRILTEEYSEK